MAQNFRHFQILYFYSVLILGVSIIGCGGNENNAAANSNGELAKGAKVPEHKDDPTCMLIFVDKTSSANISSEGNKDYLLDKMIPIVQGNLTWNADKVMVYLIQENTMSSTPFYTETITSFYEGSTSNMRTKLNQEAYQNELVQEQTTILKKLLEAIESEVPKNVADETDLWASINVIDQQYQELAPKPKMVIVYLSDMVESVSKGKCGKDYQKLTFKTHTESEKAAEKDSKVIKECYGVKQLPTNTMIKAVLPKNVTGTEHNYLPNYWKALFEEFGLLEGQVSFQ